ncbi:hypothetical protein DMUE_1348 [Dictyocoela muelleri]|nr:hypothetical protein DMUE_1348 [Dictyocoela muelleri]
MKKLKINKITGETWTIDINTNNNINITDEITITEDEIKNAIFTKYGIPVKNQILHLHKNKYYLICKNQTPIIIDHYNSIPLNDTIDDVFNNVLSKKIKLAKNEIKNSNINKIDNLIDFYDENEMNVILKNIFLYLKFLLLDD